MLDAENIPERTHETVSELHRQTFVPASKEAMASLNDRADFVQPNGIEAVESKDVNSKPNENIYCTKSDELEAIRRKRRKKTKTRSRKKNLKRDTRSASQKPTYLNEQTLKGGRLQKQPELP